MKKIQGKTFSWAYNAREDRMVLIVNKDDINAVSYWVTRRFYFSLLFEFDTVLDNLHIKDKVPPFSEGLQKPIKNPSLTAKVATPEPSPKPNKSPNHLYEPGNLLQSVNINIIEDNHKILLTFKNESTMVQSLLLQKDFIDFFMLLKRSYPKSEWGII